jgi:hypothetical protein
MEPKLIHIRKYNRFGMKACGGVTVAYKEEPNGYTLALAACTGTDRFVKKTGREIALARLAKGRTAFVPCDTAEASVQEAINALADWAPAQRIQPGVMNILKSVV